MHMNGLKMGYPFQQSGEVTEAERGCHSVPSGTRRIRSRYLGDLIDLISEQDIKTI